MEFVLPEGRDYVTYEDFGAVGDGVTDDFAAILKTHEYANEHKLTVKGTKGKTYYIFDTALGEENARSAVIKTNVDWQGARFIIDDREISLLQDNKYRNLASKHIFTVLPEDEHKVFKIEDRELLSRIDSEGINTKTEKIDLGLGYPAMIIPYSSGHKVFRRRGYSQLAPMHEIIILDKDGRVSHETPIMFDYHGIDYIEVYRLDPESAITIENGVFETLESRVNHFITNPDGTKTLGGGYIARGMNVTRSYTTVKNIEHIVSGGFTILERVNDGVEGSPYVGFFRAAYADHVTFRDCIMPGRTAYSDKNGHSSYNFGALCVNKIVLDNCIQPNFWVTVDPVTYEVKNATVYDKDAVGHARPTSPDAVPGMGFVYSKDGELLRRMCWGIGGTNFCKNMEYLNSTLSRFDAHQGLYHGKVVNCNISGLELTGVGDFIFEGSNWHPYADRIPLLFLRADYGFHWDGDILIRNVGAYMRYGSEVNIANHTYTNWYYGYTCVFPNITLDGLRFYDAKDGALLKEYKVNLFKFTKKSERMHLYDAGEGCILPLIDDDGDGYIDEPLFDINRDGKIDELDRVDLDGDGRVGNTSLRLEEYYNEQTRRKGIVHPTCTVNVNPIKPPRYFKLVNNECESGELYCRCFIKDTSVEGISDGAWNRNEDEPDTMGGFFGTTKFIYGEGEGDFLLGTDKDQKKTESLVFVEEYFE